MPANLGRIVQTYLPSDLENLSRIPLAVPGREPSRDAGEALLETDAEAADAAAEGLTDAPFRHTRGSLVLLCPRRASW